MEAEKQATEECLNEAIEENLAKQEELKQTLLKMQSMEMKARPSPCSGP